MAFDTCWRDFAPRIFCILRIRPAHSKLILAWMLKEVGVVRGLDRPWLHVRSRLTVLSATMTSLSHIHLHLWGEAAVGHRQSYMSPTRSTGSMSLNQICTTNKTLISYCVGYQHWFISLKIIRKILGFCCVTLRFNILALYLKSNLCPKKKRVRYVSVFSVVWNGHQNATLRRSLRQT